MKYRLSIAFISGILTGLSCEPFGWWLIAWFGLVPLWCLVVDSKSYKNNIIIGLAWGLGYHGLTSSWILGIHPMTWMGVPWLFSLLIALACWTLLSLWGASLVVFWSIILTFFWIKDYPAFLKVMLGVTIWTLLEQLYSLTPLWWSSLSLTQSPGNIIILQLGSISGSFTITAILVLINGVTAEAVRQKNNRKILVIVAIILYCSFFTVGWSLYHRPLESREALKIGLIQGNIPNEIKLYPEGFQKAIEGYTQGYLKLVEEGAQLVITPETALPFFWDSITKYGTFYPALLKARTPVILGAFGNVNNDYSNSLFMIDGEGKLLGRYDKTKLVPLGEYIPFEEILGGIISRLSPLKTRLIPGKEQQVIDSPFGRVVLGICYESAYGEVFRQQTKEGGEYIVTASNNAHYSAAMPAQHHAQDVMRAIENDRWMARVTNTGYSAIVNPRGDVLWRSSLKTYTLHLDTLYRQQTKTLYVQWGNWLTPFLLGIVGVSWVYFKRFSP